MFTQHLGVERPYEAGDFAQVLAAIDCHPDIGLMTVNLGLPGIAGSVGLRRLRTEHPSMLLVVVASTRDRDLVLQALGAGVHGYVPMDLSAEEMLGAFRSVLSGQIYVPTLMSEVCAKRLAVAPGSGSHDLSFTDRQSQVLALMTAGRSNKEIARALQIAEGTVKVHITAAFRLLGVHNRVSAAAAMRYRPLSDPMSEASIPRLTPRNDSGVTAMDKPSMVQVHPLWQERAFQAVAAKDAAEQRVWQTEGPDCRG